MRGLTYYYDSRAVDPDQRALLDRLEAEDVDLVDTADWSTAELTDVYYAEIVPRGTPDRRRPRTALRNGDGAVSFSAGVLVTPDSCLIGEDVDRAFDRLFPDLYVDLYEG
jgi:hypothetical protein